MNNKSCWNRNLRIISFTIIFVIIVFVAVSRPGTIIVTKYDSNIYDEPDVMSHDLYNVDPGVTFEVTEERRGMYYVKINEPPISGWISGLSVDIQMPQIGSQGTLNSGILATSEIVDNIKRREISIKKYVKVLFPAPMYKSYDNDYSYGEQALPGQVYKILAIKNGRYKVDLGGHIYQWINSDAFDTKTYKGNAYNELYDEVARYVIERMPTCGLKEGYENGPGIVSDIGALIKDVQYDGETAVISLDLRYAKYNGRYLEKYLKELTSLLGHEITEAMDAVSYKYDKTRMYPKIMRDFTIVIIYEDPNTNEQRFSSWNVGKVRNSQDMDASPITFTELKSDDIEMVGDLEKAGEIPKQKNVDNEVLKNDKYRKDALFIVKSKRNKYNNQRISTITDQVIQRLYYQGYERIIQSWKVYTPAEAANRGLNMYSEDGHESEGESSAIFIVYWRAVAYYALGAVMPGFNTIDAAFIVNVRTKEVKHLSGHIGIANKLLNDDIFRYLK